MHNEYKKHVYTLATKDGQKVYNAVLLHGNVRSNKGACRPTNDGELLNVDTAINGRTGQIPCYRRACGRVDTSKGHQNVK